MNKKIVKMLAYNIITICFLFFQFLLLTLAISYCIQLPWYAKFLWLLLVTHQCLSLCNTHYFSPTDLHNLCSLFKIHFKYSYLISLYIILYILMVLLCIFCICLQWLHNILSLERTIINRVIHPFLDVKTAYSVYLI